MKELEEIVKDRDECIRALRLDLECERNLVENLREAESWGLHVNEKLRKVRCEEWKPAVHEKCFCKPEYTCTLCEARRGVIGQIIGFMEDR